MEKEPKKKSGYPKRLNWREMNPKVTTDTPEICLSYQIGQQL